MPGRRLRVSPRVVKRAMSRYNARGKVDRTTRKAVIAIAILGAPLTAATNLITVSAGRLRDQRGPEVAEVTRGQPVADQVIGDGAGTGTDPGQSVVYDLW